MEKAKRVKLFLSGIFVLFLIVFAICVFYFRNNGSDIDNEQVKGVLDLYSVPKIVSVAPVSVLNGEEYYYEVKLSDGDTEAKDLVLDIVEGPSWLSVEDNVVKGIARGVGTYKVVLKVSDGVNSSERKQYILVEEK